MLHLKKSMLYKQLWWDIACASFLNCESFSLQCEWDLYPRGLKPVACSFMKTYSLARCIWGKLIQLFLSRGRGLEVRHSKIYKCWTVKGSQDCIHSILWYTFNKKRLYDDTFIAVLNFLSLASALVILHSNIRCYCRPMQK